MAMNVEKQSSKFVRPLVPSPPTLRHHKISFLDEVAPPVYVPFVLFFSKDSNCNPKFFTQLEKSLEKTLLGFYPLAGRYVEESRTIDCNDEGANFVVAKVNIKLQDFLGSEDNFKLVDEYIPSKTNDAIDKFTDPLLAIQVTTFKCGGLAIGVRVSHRIADASTICTFVNKWAAMNREDNDDIKCTWTSFNSSALFPARGATPFPIPPLSDDILRNYTRIKLSFSESEIAIMKAKASSTHQLSKVQLVSAIIWKALVGLDHAIHNHPRESIILQAINLRGKMASIIPAQSCGNLLGIYATESGFNKTTKELACSLSSSTKKAIDKLSRINLDSEDGGIMFSDFLPDLSDFSPLANVTIVTSWCKFPFYEADFGFGRPTWAVPGTIPIKNTTYLMDDAGGNGVEAYIFLEFKDVPYFQQALDINVFGE